MAAQLKYNGDCSCSHSDPDGFGHECYYCTLNENRRYLHEIFMLGFLNNLYEMVEYIDGYILCSVFSSATWMKSQQDKLYVI